MLCPVASERFDLALRDARDGSCPLRCLRHAVLDTKDVILEIVEADGVRGDIVLVVGIFLDPHISQSAMQSRIGVRQDGDPLALMSSARVVEVR